MSDRLGGGQVLEDDNGSVVGGFPSSIAREAYCKRKMLASHVRIMHQWVDMCEKFPAMIFPPYDHFEQQVNVDQAWLEAGCVPLRWPNG